MNGLVSFIFFLILLEKIRFSEVATHLVSGLRVCVWFRRPWQTGGLSRFRLE